MARVLEKNSQPGIEESVTDNSETRPSETSRSQMKRRIVEEADISKYDIIQPIGSGAFGTVSLVRDKESGVLYAMKNIKCSVMNRQQQEYLKREIAIMKNADHPAILMLASYVLPTRSDPTAIIITEYMPNGSLFDLLELERKGESPQEWNATTKTKLVIGLAAGMRYLHSHDVIHRDLKSDNILLNEYLEPKICDFGLSRKSDGNESQMTKRIGTPLYMAPELFADAPYTNKVDVYAFGILAYETITGINPFSEISNPIALGMKIAQGERPAFPDETPESYKDLIERCWSGDPDERPDFEVIVKDLLSPEFILPGANDVEVNDYRRQVCPEFNMVTYDMLLSVQNYCVQRFDAVEIDVANQAREISELRKEREDQDAKLSVLESKLADLMSLFATLKSDNDTMRKEIMELREENEKLKTQQYLVKEPSLNSTIRDDEEESEEEDSISSVNYGVYNESDESFSPCLEAPFETETGGFDGILKHITEYNGGKNLCDIGLMRITGDSYSDNDNDNLRRLVDFTWDGSWGSGFSDSSWIVFEFTHNTVDVRAYSLKTNNSVDQPMHLISWVLEGSNDGEKWIELDRVEDYDSPDCSTHECQSPSRSSFRYIRLMQTGPSHGGSGSGFALTNIEFFGSLY